MAKENEDVEEEETDEVDDSDTTDWKLETMKLREKRIRDREGKKALKDKIAELEGKLSEHQSGSKEQKKSEDEVMKRLDILALKMANITADDEVELYDKWKRETGRDGDAIIGNKIFQSELAELKTAKSNADAANAKGDGKHSSGKDADYYISKMSQDSEGSPVFSEDLPNDPNLRGAILDKLVSKSKGGGQFYNQK